MTQAAMRPGATMKTTVTLTGVALLLSVSGCTPKESGAAAAAIEADDRIVEQVWLRYRNYVADVASTGASVDVARFQDAVQFCEETTGIGYDVGSDVGQVPAPELRDVLVKWDRWYASNKGNLMLRWRAGCLSIVMRPSPARSGPDADGVFSRGRCGSEGFTQSASEHIIVELEKPLRVRTVEGTRGDWPDGVSPLFEVRGRGDAPSQRRQVRSDYRGYFKVPGLRAGEYCFKATVDGWQSVTGVIVVSPAADPASRVNFEMRLGA